jgi:hypothetical protein
MARGWQRWKQAAACEKERKQAERLSSIRRHRVGILQGLAENIGHEIETLETQHAVLQDELAKAKSILARTEYLENKAVMKAHTVRIEDFRCGMELLTPEDAADERALLDDRHWESAVKDWKKLSAAVGRFQNQQVQMASLLLRSLDPQRKAHVKRDGGR